MKFRQCILNLIQKNMIYFTTEYLPWSANYNWCYQQRYPQQYEIAQPMNTFQWSYPHYSIGNYSYLAPISPEGQISTPKIPRLEQNPIIQEEQFDYEEEQSLNSIRQRRKVKYVKKNAESNVINRIFSYLSMRSKSQDVLKNIFKGNMEKIDLYYEVMKQIRRKNKKYINRCYLKQLMELNPEQFSSKLISNLEKKQILGKEEIKRALRVLTSYYMKAGYVNSILTSSKLDKATKYEHIRRGKAVQSYLKNINKIR